MKNAKRRRGTECFQNQNFHIKITKNKNTKKPTNIIVYNIIVLFFQIKLVPRKIEIFA